MSYPRLVINKGIMKRNIENILSVCDNQNIEAVAVVKGVNGLSEIIQIFIESGIKTIASSRLPHLKKVKALNNAIQTYALRITMPSEVEELVECADISLQSDLSVIRQINEVCAKKNVTHNVIIMCELGDLREGIYAEDELKQSVLAIENELPHVHLLGIGAGLGCYGSILPTVEKMNELIKKAEYVTKLIGRPIEVVSGGSTTAYPLVGKGIMPTGITQLRIGDGFYINDLDDYFEFETLKDEAITLEAEIVEIKEKPSYPIGVIAVNAFGDKVEYEDRGIRTRALVAIGKQDIGDYTKILPLDKTIEVIGGSSDHTILDITNAQVDYKVGDIIDFHVMYEALLMTTQSVHVKKEFIN